MVGARKGYVGAGKYEQSRSLVAEVSDSLKGQVIWEMSQGF